MEEVLKSLCNSSKAKGTLFQKEWDLLPLPSLPREGKPYFLDFNNFNRPLVSDSQCKTSFW